MADISQMANRSYNKSISKINTPELNICHLYPDVLNLYGDRGNVLSMCYRLEKRGVKVNLRRAGIGEKAELSGCDLAFIGGGQDFEQEALLEDLHSGKDMELCSAIEDGLTVLAICGGYQMLGSYYETWDGQRCGFLGALDLYTVGSKERMIGNFLYTCTELSTSANVFSEKSKLKSNDSCVIVGFENHSGKTYLGGGVSPMGQVLRGSGNNGEDGTEGARYKNVFATYSHGPLLPKNPALCDYILGTAFQRKYGRDWNPPPLDDTAEITAHDEMAARLWNN